MLGLTLVAVNRSRVKDSTTTVQYDVLKFGTFCYFLDPQGEFRKYRG